MEPARLERILRLKIPFYIAAAVLQIAGIYLGLLWAPILSTGFSSPVAQRIFYFHLGAALASYVGFSVTLVGSVLYLRKRDLFFDSLSRDAAGLGLAFALMVLTSGPRVVLPGGGGIGPEGGMVVGICVTAAMLLFVALLLSRTELTLLEAKIERL